MTHVLNYKMRNPAQQPKIMSAATPLSLNLFTNLLILRGISATALPRRKEMVNDQIDLDAILDLREDGRSVFSIPNNNAHEGGAGFVSFFYSFFLFMFGLQREER